jgi:hypothetical protein
VCVCMCMSVCVCARVCVKFAVYVDRCQRTKLNHERCRQIRKWKYLWQHTYIIRSAHARGVALAFPTSSKCGGETQMGPHLCLQRLNVTHREKPCPNLPIRNVRAGGDTRLPLSKHPVLDLPGRAQGIGCRCRLTPPQAHLPCGCREEIPPFS